MINTDTFGDYAGVKLVNEEDEPSLKFGEFLIKRDESTVFVGCNGFPVKEEGDNNNG